MVEQTLIRPEKRLYSLKDAAQYLGRSEWAMREIYWAGKIPAVREGPNSRIYFDVQDLDSYIESNKVCEVP